MNGNFEISYVPRRERFLRVFKQKSDLAGGPNLTRTSEESDPKSQKNDCVLTMHFITI